MGIPSYYRRLIKQVYGFYCPRPDSIDRLLMDYNCLIYQVLRSVPAGSGSEWENRFIEDICKYTAHIMDSAHVTPDKVYIAMDGIVPLAKMKQQRMRRFRAAATAVKDAWDTNAITPGTSFMKNLALSLRSTFPTATISDTGEFGEGEHKLMSYMRKHGSEGNNVIYGLDGDLFVLGILNQALFTPSANIFFLRENTMNKENPNELVWHSLQALRTGLLKEKSVDLSDNEWLKEYAIAMSLLGNDFVPNGLAFRIREGGHERLLSYLVRLHSSGLRLCGKTNGLLVEGWIQIFKWLAADEERFILKSIQQKKNAVMAAKGNFTSEDLPLQRFEDDEGQLLWQGESLHRDWKKIYARVGLEAPLGAEIHYLTDSARQYINALEWIYNYYCCSGLQEAVDFNWMYPYSTAPLFGAVSAIFTGFSAPFDNSVRVSGLCPVAKPTVTEPQLDSVQDSVRVLMAKPTVTEQLAIVLPPASWYLIPKCPERQLLVKAPYLFPKGELKYYSFGKRFTWECEAHIPIPTISDVRSILK